LHQHLRVDGAWNRQNCRHAGRGHHPKHHESLPTVVTLEFHLRPALRRRPMPGLCHGPRALVTGANSAALRGLWLEMQPVAVVGRPFHRPSTCPWHALPTQPAAPAATDACTMTTAIPRAIGEAALNSPAPFAIRATDFYCGSGGPRERAWGMRHGSCRAGRAVLGAFWGAFSKSVGDQGLTYGIDVRYGGQYHYRDVRHSARDHQTGKPRHQ